MSRDFVMPEREYGRNYLATAQIADLPTLAERILADLQTIASRELAAGADLSIHVRGSKRLTLCLGGLANGYLFACLRTRRPSEEAQELIKRAYQLLDTYNWRTLNDARDVRFLPNVVVVSEEDYGSDRWTPGVVVHEHDDWRSQ
ncbi:hypothetical protein SAMN04489729_0829 [Amycolatopsis lurida]|uniref:Uncharacterized protein n=1 Tax=Amycolatopsis lurida NRRL 2430 TaxID=1460371 RepID=A0A2P2FM22_AMYLU|nr:hypothetical protein [Amycolatopsis lurida]KFU77778.1 hypothetical protein BB31_29370 [Amycolatopsis lurida NRRL 2430]SEB39039.1 hypothetical protein SAMN04489729_0829 [Amycolatopsis lurida]